MTVTVDLPVPGARPRDRRPRRRHRVRLRRHAREVGRRRRARDDVRLHRRLQGHLGRRRRSRRARSRRARTSNATRPRSSAPSTSCSCATSTASSTAASATTRRGVPRDPRGAARRRARARSRGSRTGSIPTTTTPGCSSRRASSRRAIRTSSPSRVSRRTGPTTLLCFEPGQVDHVENVDGYVDRKVDALLAHRSQWRSTMAIDDDPDDRARRVRGEAARRGPRRGTPGRTARRRSRSPASTTSSAVAQPSAGREERTRLPGPFYETSESGYFFFAVRLRVVRRTARFAGRLLRGLATLLGRSLLRPPCAWPEPSSWPPCAWPEPCA